MYYVLVFVPCASDSLEHTRARVASVMYFGRYFKYVYFRDLRDGPLEKLWRGGGEFSNRRNFFSLSNSLDEFFLGHGMNIF